jgi:hypothetical protein
MTATHSASPHEHPAVDPTRLFSPSEWQQLRHADWTAGAYIVGLMAGIFSVGLVLYLLVLWSVLS